MPGLFAILGSAANVLLGWVFRSLIVKFVIFFALWFVTTELVGVLVNHALLPNSQALSGAFSGIPASVWYFLDIFALPAGLPMLISAAVTRFIIRRIPVIG